VKQVYCELKRLHYLGFKTWFTNVESIKNKYGIKQFNGNLNQFKGYCKSIVFEHFNNEWRSQLNDIHQNPKLRMYKDIKSDIKFECHLFNIPNVTHRKALTRFRSSSHRLEIECGRYTTPTTKIDDRLCKQCKIVEDECHFLISCHMYSSERQKFFNTIQSIIPNFLNFDVHTKFILLMTSENPKLLRLTSKFVNDMMSKRSILLG
jgi:hypothetical protein